MTALNLLCSSEDPRRWNGEINNCSDRNCQQDNW